MSQWDDSVAGAEGANAGDPLLAMVAIHKHFGGVRALQGTDLTLQKGGVVHSLMGENGSGKSTLLGILSGQLRPDAGSVFLDGESVTFSNPAQAVARGIAMVSQEIAVAPDLSVAENILLGRRLVRGPAGIDWARTRARAADVLERLGLDLDPAVLVRRLRPDQRQMVEIARAASMNARVLILDEPTSSLTDDEVQNLFRAVRRMTDQGVAIIFVSHRIPEVLEIADHITVLRDGRTVSTGPVREYDGDALVDAMVGRAGARVAAGNAPGTEPGADRSAALELHDVCAANAVREVTLSVRRGEIVGLAGLVGAGRTELLEAIFGLRPITDGSVLLEGNPLSAHAPRQAIERGLGYLPPDRKTQGLVLQLSIKENLTMVANLDRPRLSIVRDRRNAAQVEEAVTTMRISAPSLDAPAGTLSGGNQQKVALAKWLAAGTRVLLMDEPTRGVDVAAKAEIHELLRRATTRGLALLVSSSENDELLALCDHILVMFRGSVVARLSAAEASEATIASAAGGHV